MADPSAYSGSGEDAGEPDHETTGTPRWVKLFGLIALLLIVLIVVMLLLGGNHGPGRHMS